ncbi:hypothetical protein O9929_25870 [Vibrio lentus]|nr:hypothetical protein [Vibrio lentus]
MIVLIMMVFTLQALLWRVIFLQPTHILTAAHCIYGNEEGQLFTTVVPQIEDTSQFPNGNIQKSAVSKFIHRSDYSNALVIYSM